MSSNNSFVAKFKCQGSCGKKMGVIRDRGAKFCERCLVYFKCWACNETYYINDDKRGLCNECRSKPKICDQPNCMVEIPENRRTCSPCILNSGIVILPDEEEGLGTTEFPTMGFEGPYTKH